MLKVGINKRDEGRAIKYVSVSWCLGYDLIHYDLHRSKVQQKKVPVPVESDWPKWITKLYRQLNAIASNDAHEVHKKRDVFGTLFSFVTNLKKINPIHPVSLLSLLRSLNGTQGIVAFQMGSIRSCMEDFRFS